MQLSSKAIECRNLSVGYQAAKQHKLVLHGIDTAFEKGQLTAIAGLNGAGKSTLLKTISGLLKPLAGNILLFGKEITQLKPSALSQLISLVLTDRPEEQYLTVYETVASGRAPYTGFWGRLSQADHLAIEKSLEYTSISHLKDNFLNSISDGERQKVMIAKALAQDTPIIVLDEPAAFLDFPSKIELMHLLKRLTTEQQKTVLFSSHDLDLIIRTADHVWLLGNGVQVGQGAPEILLRQNAFASAFGNQRLRFDTLSGHFVVHDAIRGTYFFENDTVDKTLVSSALQRKGFIPSALPQADLVVRQQAGIVQITFKGKTHNFENFEALIYGIQNL
ncbi:MAG: ABC transporter ATP-binding protein [Bacteroidetes bacterium]|nr:ABC transporter ATP-binding protein [Bacteroidota bacterium]